MVLAGRLPAIMPGKTGSGKMDDQGVPWWHGVVPGRTPGQPVDRGLPGCRAYAQVGDTGAPPVPKGLASGDRLAHTARSA